MTNLRVLFADRWRVAEPSSGHWIHPRTQSVARADLLCRYCGHHICLSEGVNRIGSSAGSFLEGLSEERLSAIWDTWLRDYWSDRTTGVPLPLDPKERHGMMTWLVALRPHLDEALPLIALTAPEKLDHYIFYKIGHSNLPTEHPIDTGRLLVTMLNAATDAEYSCDEIFDTAFKAAIAGAAAADVAAIVGQPAALGQRHPKRRDGVVQ